MTKSKSAMLRRRDFLAVGAAGAVVLAETPFALAQVRQAAPDAPQAAAATVRTTRVETPGPNGVITAGHPLAASAGLRMLLAGGGAGDAAVAAMAVLNVVEPWASSAAGNGFATVYTPTDGVVKSLNFAGAAPRLLDGATINPRDLDWGPKRRPFPARSAAGSSY